MVPIRPSNTFACERGCRTRISIALSAGPDGILRDIIIESHGNVVFHWQRRGRSRAVGDTCYAVVRLMFLVLVSTAIALRMFDAAVLRSVGSCAILSISATPPRVAQPHGCRKAERSRPVNRQHFQFQRHDQDSW